MDFSHIPVLEDDVINQFKEIDNFKFYFDGTFGRGGHCQSVLNYFPEVKAIVCDRDLEAEVYANEVFKIKWSGRFEFFHNNFSEVNSIVKTSQILAGSKFDAILIDLGVSSPQLDNGERGFSFYHNGPLDMRMNQKQDLTAKEIVNSWSLEELVDLFKDYGEVRSPLRAVERIIEARNLKPIETTDELSEIFVKADGWRKKGHHPATKYFLALRLKVNDEIDSLSNNLIKLINSLSDRGRLAVITFHSMEDRIVKNCFKESKGLGIIVNKKVIQAKWEEKKKNIRARSAKLRVFERRICEEEKSK